MDDIQRISIFKRLRYSIVNHTKSFIMYPFLIKKRYNIYNGRLVDMMKVYSRPELKELMQRNVKYVNLFILLPIFMGFVAFLVNVSMHYDNYVHYIDMVNKIIHVSSNGDFIDAIVLFFKKIYLVFKILFFPSDHIKKFMPDVFLHLGWILLGYMFSVIGAFFLSRNIIFLKEKEIQDVMIHQKKLDKNGYPWPFIWTPFGIYMKFYNFDVQTLYTNTKFWNSINFRPGPPLVYESDTAKIVFPKKYELPSKVIYSNVNLVKELMTDQNKKNTKNIRNTRNKKGTKKGKRNE